MTSIEMSGSILSFPKTNLYHPLPVLSLYQADFVPGVNFQSIAILLQARSKLSGLKLAGMLVRVMATARTALQIYPEALVQKKSAVVHTNCLSLLHD